MFSSLKQKAKKLGLILALGSATAVVGCAQKDTRSEAQKQNDAMVEMAQKSGRYMVSSEPDDKNKNYYSDMVNKIFENAETIMDYVYKNKSTKSVNASLKQLFDKSGIDKNKYVIFIKNYGSHDDKTVMDWISRFQNQAEASKELTESGKKGLVPLTKDGQFWRYTNNSVNHGFMRPTFADTKSYRQKNHRLNKEPDLVCRVVDYTGR